MKTILALSDPRLNDGKLPLKVVELAEAADLVLCAEVTLNPAYEALKTICGSKLWPLPGELPIIQDWEGIKILLANQLYDSDQFIENLLMIAAEGYSADLLVFGHINQPIIVWGKKEKDSDKSHLLVCPGSSSTKSIYIGSYPSVALVHINDDGSFSTELVRIASLKYQRKWRWCPKCQGLFYAPNVGISKCPADGKTHDDSRGGHYLLAVNDSNAAGQKNWRRCQKCQGLFYAPNAGTSKCPADGKNHDGSIIGNYTLIHNDPNAPGQANWRWCKKCQGLFFGGGNDGFCPSGGTKKEPHIKIDSGNYRVEFD